MDVKIFIYKIPVKDASPAVKYILMLFLFILRNFNLGASVHLIKVLLCKSQASDPFLVSKRNSTYDSFRILVSSLKLQQKAA